MRTINPIFTSFSVVSMKAVINYCKTFPRFKALVVCKNLQEMAIFFTDVPTKEFFGGKVRIDRINGKINISFDNGSCIDFLISSGNLIGRRVNAVLYSNNINQDTLYSAYNPMQVPYYLTEKQ